MKRATKKKPAPVEPLQPTPIPMNVEEPAVQQAPTMWENFQKLTAPMSPEKTNVIRLYTEAVSFDGCCNKLWRCRRNCYKAATAIKKTRGYTRRRQNLKAKARTKKEQAELAALDEELAEARTYYWDCVHQWDLMNIQREYAWKMVHIAKIARLERLLRDAGGEW